MDWQSNIKWATQEASVKIDRLMEENQYAAAFMLASEALSYAPNEPSLEHLLESASLTVQVESDPPGAISLTALKSALYDFSRRLPAKATMLMFLEFLDSKGQNETGLITMRLQFINA